MCGINGFISTTHTAAQKQAVVERMNKRLAHRGPNSDGAWNDELACLGHRRLSIIDLSPESNQPFFSTDRRYVIVYNGELYNYKELKLELQRSSHGLGYTPYFFKTASDTEVILAAYIRWGNKCLEYFNGMFAFAVYDTEQQSLFVARDRLGVKPLYYYYGDEGFLFSSEVRAILHSGVKTFSLNTEAVAEYAMYQTVLAPNTIVKSIKMLMPGHYAEVTQHKASITRYYTPNNINTAAAQELNYKDTCKKVHELLAHSVQRRLVADVPFGAFLSGGIDSSAVVGLMSEVSNEKVKTFNISFDESEFSESKYAQLIAKKFNTHHHEIKLRPDDFLKQLPEALAAIDHPTGDGPNTYIVSKATKQAGITMALSGIGGDELFAGYDVFKRMSQLQKRSWINALPGLARRSAGLAIRLQKRSVSGNKISELLAQPKINFNTAYPLNRSLYTQRELSALLRNPQPFGMIKHIVGDVPQIDGYLLSAVSVAEINTYLQNVLLRDTDQMSMAVALEVREPFLDHRLVEFVLGISDAYKFPHSPKKLLTDSLGDLLPDEIVNRPKMGFTLPWQYWLKNELKTFCEKNIFEFSEYDFCNKQAIRDLWKRFLKGDRTVTWSRIWHLVVLNNWIRENNLQV